MAQEPRRSVLVGRRGLLFALLAVVLVVLVVKWNDLALAYGLNSAERAIRSRDWTSAIAILEQFTQRGEKSPRWHFLLARCQRRAGLLPQAEDHLVRAAALGWNPAEIDRQRLLIKAAAGLSKEAEARLAALLQSELSDEAGEEVYEAMARGYLATYQMAEARRCLEFWSQWQRDNVLPHLWMGDMWRHFLDPIRAADEYRKVLECDPHHSDARIKLAQILLDRLEIEEAEPLLVGVLADQPESPDALLGLANIRRRQGALEDAQSLLYDALMLDLQPHQTAAALATLGQVALEDRRYFRAAQLLDQSAAINPNVPATHLALAAALAALGQGDQAASHRATAARIQEQTTRMVTLMQQIVAEPNNPDPRCETGLILMEQGLWSAGAQWLKTAVAIDPGHPAANEGLARYYVQIGNPAAAERHRRDSLPSSKRPVPAATNDHD